MPLAAIGFSSMAYWYLTRATGVVSLLLLTLAMALGVADVARFSSVHWPRFLTDGLHRRASLLALIFLVIHILTSVLDTYAPISLIDAFVPFHSAYRPLWLGLGAAAFDLLLAVLLTSLLRARVGARNWRAVHWLAYACWPLAVFHGLGTGTDVRQTWMLALDAICVVVVMAAVGVRLRTAADVTPGGRALAFGLPAVFLLALAIWLPAGPLAPGWARRAGTPVKLIAGQRTTPAAAGSR